MSKTKRRKLEKDLYEGIKLCNLEQCLSALESGVNIETRYFTSSFTPLMLAVAELNTSIVEILLERGAYVNAQSRMGNSPVHYSLASNLPLLIAYSADIDIKNESSQTPLMSAIWQRDVEKVQSLLSNNVSLSEVNDLNQTPYMQSLKQRDIEIEKKMYLGSVGIDTQTNDDLEFNVYLNKLESKRILISRMIYSEIEKRSSRSTRTNNS